MYIWRCTPRRQTPAAVPHDVKSLPPWGTAAGAWFRRQGGAVWRQDPAAKRHNGRSLPLCHTMLGLFYFFIFKTLLTFLKTTN
jgi:hypothetical protein